MKHERKLPDGRKVVDKITKQDNDEVSVERQWVSPTTTDEHGNKKWYIDGEEYKGTVDNNGVLRPYGENEPGVII